MIERLPEPLRVPEELYEDTIKRAIGASIILLATLPVPNKQGWTVEFALRMSDAVGPYVRDVINKSSDTLKQSLTLTKN